jgi:phenylalanyl-tRNA synthetase beta chain
MEKETSFQEISRFQKIERELNFVVDETTRTWAMAEHLSAVHPWIQNISVDSVYRDDAKVGAGKKSVNFAFDLISTENTISDSDAWNVQAMIIARMEELWYTLRS